MICYKLTSYPVGNMTIVKLNEKGHRNGLGPDFKGLIDISFLDLFCLCLKESFHSHLEHSNWYWPIQQHQIVLLCKPYEREFSFGRNRIEPSKEMHDLLDDIFPVCSTCLLKTSRSIGYVSWYILCYFLHHSNNFLSFFNRRDNISSLLRKELVGSDTKREAGTTTKEATLRIKTTFWHFLTYFSRSSLVQGWGILSTTSLEVGLERRPKKIANNGL